MQQFLDDHHLAGLAEGFVDHNAFEGEQSVRGLRADEDALARREARCFDDDARVARGDVVVGSFVVGEDPALGGGDVGLAHELLGVGLVALDAGGRGRRAEDAQAGGLEAVDDARAQGRLRPHDGEIDVAAAGQLHQAVDVARVCFDALAEAGGAGVSGNAEQFVHAG